MKNLIIKAEPATKETEGTVRYKLKDGRSPKQYYGLAVATLNRTFEWGAPWRVVGHEVAA